MEKTVFEMESPLLAATILRKSTHVFDTTTAPNAFSLANIAMYALFVVKIIHRKVVPACPGHGTPEIEPEKPDFIPEILIIFLKVEKIDYPTHSITLPSLFPIS